MINSGFLCKESKNKLIERLEIQKEEYLKKNKVTKLTAKDNSGLPRFTVSRKNSRKKARGEA